MDHRLERAQRKGCCRFRVDFSSLGRGESKSRNFFLGSNYLVRFMVPIFVHAVSVPRDVTKYTLISSDLQCSNDSKASLLYNMFTNMYSSVSAPQHVVHHTPWVEPGPFCDVFTIKRPHPACQLRFGEQMFKPVCCFFLQLNHMSLGCGQTHVSQRCKRC